MGKATLCWQNEAVLLRTAEEQEKKGRGNAVHSSTFFTYIRCTSQWPPEKSEKSVQSRYLYSAFFFFIFAVVARFFLLILVPPPPPLSLARRTRRTTRGSKGKRDHISREGELRWKTKTKHVCARWDGKDSGVETHRKMGWLMWSREGSRNSLERS